MKNLKLLSCTLLLVFFLPQLCFSQEQQSTSNTGVQFSIIDWNNVWENLNTVENNTKEQMKYNETLNSQLETLSQQLKDKETAFAYQSLLLQNSEEALKKSDNTVQIWKTTSIVLTVSLVGTITALVIIATNK